MPAVVLLRTPLVNVEPGSEAAAELTIRNTGTVVDQFLCNLLGEASAWARCDPPVVSLFPEAEETIRIVFSPPRTASVTAGVLAYGVQVKSSEDPDFSIVEEGSVQVGGFAALSVKVVPRTSEGKRNARHRVEIANAGNAPLTATIDATDPDEMLAFDIDPPTIEVPGGGDAYVGLRVVGKSNVKGNPRRFPFTVSVEANGAVTTAEAAFEQKPKAKVLIWIAVALVAAVLVFLVKDSAQSAELDTCQGSCPPAHAETPATAP